MPGAEKAKPICRSCLTSWNELPGWAQLHHVPEVSLVETRLKVEYDLYYIKNMNLLMDFLIFFHTIRTLLYRTGAR